MIAVGIVHWLRYTISKDDVSYIPRRPRKFEENPPIIFTLRNYFKSNLTGLEKQ